MFSRLKALAGGGQPDTSDPDPASQESPSPPSGMEAGPASTSSSSLPPSDVADTRSTEQQIVEALDKTAVRLLRQLDAGAVDPATGKQYDQRHQMKVFDQLTDWLSRRAKLKPDDGDDVDPAGIRAMREAMRDVAAETAMQLMKERGVPMMPVKKHNGGRPNRVEARQRMKVKRVQARLNEQGAKSDDSGLARLVRETGYTS